MKTINENESRIKKLIETLKEKKIEHSVKRFERQIENPVNLEKLKETVEEMRKINDLHMKFAESFMPGITEKYHEYSRRNNGVDFKLREPLPLELKQCNFLVACAIRDLADVKILASSKYKKELLSCKSYDGLTGADIAFLAGNKKTFKYLVRQGAKHSVDLSDSRSK